MSEKFLLRGLKKDVRSWANSCLARQREKVHRHTVAPLASLAVPERRSEHVNVDLVGPLPPSPGHSYLFTVIDRTTRWPEVIPLTPVTTAELARALVSFWVSRFGVLDDLSSDRGAPFTRESSAAIAHQLGVTLHQTSAYHHRAIGMCEHFHRSLKASLSRGVPAKPLVSHVPATGFTTHRGSPRSRVLPGLSDTRFVFVLQPPLWWAVWGLIWSVVLLVPRPPTLRPRSPAPDSGPDSGPDPDYSHDTDSKMSPDFFRAPVRPVPAGKRLWRFGRVIRTPKRLSSPPQWILGELVGRPLKITSVTRQNSSLYLCESVYVHICGLWPSCIPGAQGYTADLIRVPGALSSWRQEGADETE